MNKYDLFDENPSLFSSSSLFLSNRLYCYHWANCRIRKKSEIFIFYFYQSVYICCTSLLFYTWCSFCCFVYCVNVSLFLCMSLLTASILSLSQRFSSLNKWGVSGMYLFHQSKSDNSVPKLINCRHLFCQQPLTQRSLTPPSLMIRDHFFWGIPLLAKLAKGSANSTFC